MNGPGLKALRLRKHITTIALADRTGWARRRISQLEGQALVSERDVTRYLDALATFAAAA